MEHQKNDNLNMLEAVVQNTEMGKNTLAQILPMAGDARFKAELIRQRSGYQELNQEAHAGLDACGSRAQGQSAFAKMNTKMGISFKTLTDKSTRQPGRNAVGGQQPGDHGLHQVPEGLSRRGARYKAPDAAPAGL